MRGGRTINVRWVTVLLMALLFCLVLAGGALAGAMVPEGYRVPWSAYWGGGGVTSSTNYAINGTVGQGAIGWAEGAGHAVGAGFWYGASLTHKVYLPVVLRVSS